MLFSSITFLFVFLPIVLAVYFLVPYRFKNLVMLIASLFFYAWGEPVYVILMILSICLNYVCGLDIAEKADDDRKKRNSLIFAVVVNLLLLGFFKYYGFLMESVNAVLPFDIPYRELPLPIISGAFLHYRCISGGGKAAEKADVFCTLYFYVPAADRRTDRAVCGY